MSDTTSRPALVPAPPVFHSRLAVALLEEWDRLRRAPDVRARLAEEPFAHLAAPAEFPNGEGHPLDAVLAACGFLRPATDTSDRAMLELVVAGRTDPLAARIALQRLLPGLVAIARRRGPIEGGAQRAFDDVLSWAWIGIRSYPADRRPRKIAPNLVRDAEYRAFVQPKRLKAAAEWVGLPVESSVGAAVLDGRDATGRVEPLAEVVDLLDIARRCGLPATDLAFASAWLNGADTIELAQRFGVCERTVRNRRREVAERLRDVALAA